MLAKLIGGFVALLIGVSLIGPIANWTTSVTNDGSLGAFILKLIPAFFALGVAAIGLFVCYNGLKSSGVFEQPLISSQEINPIEVRNLASNKNMDIGKHYKGSEHVNNVSNSKDFGEVTKYD
jgi:hypothetical protein